MRQVLLPFYRSVQRSHKSTRKQRAGNSPGPARHRYFCSTSYYTRYGSMRSNPPKRNNMVGGIITVYTQRLAALKAGLSSETNYRAIKLFFVFICKNQLISSQCYFNLDGQIQFKQLAFRENISVRAALKKTTVSRLYIIVKLRNCRIRK